MGKPICKVRWHGHSCFLISLDGGPRVLTDPFSDTGLPETPIECDIVVSSHDHHDHNNFSLAVGAKRALKGQEQVGQPPLEIDGARFSFVGVKHDNAGGSKRGADAVVIVTWRDFHLVHVGDLGHPPTMEQVKAIGRVDALFLPVGGVYTVELNEALKTIELLKPKHYIFPMHYKIPGLTIKVGGPEAFIARARKVVKSKVVDFEIDAEHLPASPETIVLPRA